MRKMETWRNEEKVTEKRIRKNEEMVVGEKNTLLSLLLVYEFLSDYYYSTNNRDEKKRLGSAEFQQWIFNFVLSPW